MQPWVRPVTLRDCDVLCPHCQCKMVVLRDRALCGCPGSADCDLVVWDDSVPPVLNVPRDEPVVEIRKPVVPSSGKPQLWMTRRGLRQERPPGVASQDAPAPEPA